MSNWTAEDGILTTYHCVVPSNTTAELYLPVAKDICVDVNRLPAGVEFKGMVTHNGFDTALFYLPSGGFCFTIAGCVVHVDISDGYIQSI